MGGYLSQLYDRIFRRFWALPPQKIVILGLDNAGKTTILYQFFLRQAFDTVPTIGSNVEEINYKNTKFILWDIGGQESLRASWSTYFVGTKILIFVVDSWDRQRLASVKKELWAVIDNDQMKQVIVLIYANKQDLQGVMSVDGVAKALEIERIKKTHMCEVFGSCALTGEGLFQGLDWVLSKTHGWTYDENLL